MSTSCCKNTASILWVELNHCGKVAGYGEGVGSRRELQGTVIASHTHGQGRRDKTTDEIMNWPVVATISHFPSFVHYYI